MSEYASPRPGQHLHSVSLPDLATSPRGSWDKVRGVVTVLSAAELAKQGPRETKLRTAATENDFELAEGLIDVNNVDINCTNAFGWTPLHCAAYYASDQTLQLLISRNAKLDIQDKEGETPLFLAVQKSNIACAQMLLNAGADVNVQQNTGDLPLHHAAELGDDEMVELLLAFGMDPDQVNHHQDTPFHIAVNNGELNIVDLMLQADANPTKTNGEDMTPEQLAVWSGHLNIAQRLREVLNKSHKGRLVNYSDSVRNKRDEILKKESFAMRQELQNLMSKQNEALHRRKLAEEERKKRAGEVAPDLDEVERRRREKEQEEERALARQIAQLREKTKEAEERRAEHNAMVKEKAKKFAAEDKIKEAQQRKKQQEVEKAKERLASLKMKNKLDSPNRATNRGAVSFAGNTSPRGGSYRGNRTASKSPQGRSAGPRAKPRTGGLTAGRNSSSPTRSYSFASSSPSSASFRQLPGKPKGGGSPQTSSGTANTPSPQKSPGRRNFG